MADERLPLLRGRVTSVDTYEAPQRGGGGSTIPPHDPQAHRANLLAQLDVIQQQIQARSQPRDALATREIIAVRPAPDAKLAPDQLASAGADARLVGVVAETGAVVLDVAKPDLGYLRKKVDDFADDAKVAAKKNRDGTPKVDDEGEPILARKSEKAVAPIGAIGLAALVDVSGPLLRVEPLKPDQPYWFEIGCRGGYRDAPAERGRSRAEMAQQLQAIGAAQQLDEFVAPERVYFFVRLTEQQLEALRATTDCIYEVELAPPPIRDLRLLDDLTTSDLKSFSLHPPPADAPAVVVLDSGIATGHPLLEAAILSATTAGPEIPSAEDTHGHGTKMAGVALYRDLGAAIQRGESAATHWLQSSRLIIAPGVGTAADENHHKWPVLTLGAVRSAEAADPRPRPRAFTIAIARSMQEPPLDGLVPTLWSHAVDQIAFGEDRGRLMIVAAGNARDTQWLALAEQYPQLQLSEKIHQPAQASNALTVGAFTARVELPSLAHYTDYHVVATRPGAISPFTSTGPAGSEWPIKPDVVLEGGNLAISTPPPRPNPTVPTLCTLTTSHRHTIGQPVGLMNMTSEATAHAGRLAAHIWTLEPDLRPETVRGLIVHSATWTDVMREQFPGLDDRLQACGYGVPNERVASECAQGVATVVVEDAMPNVVIEQELKKQPPKRPGTKKTEPKDRRKVKLYRLPIPETLLTDDDPEVELRVTLSYFAEPKKFGRSTSRGLDLKWDMQGPHESEEAFLQRINVLKRPKGPDGKRAKPPQTKSFGWDIRINRRSRGTVQSDRWRGRMSELVGDKLIAIVPVLGWWERRKALRELEMRFSLIASVFGPGVYAAIKPRIDAAAASSLLEV